MGAVRQRAIGKHRGIEQLEQRCVLSGTPLITEFMASNSTTLLDGDLQSSDWVEIYNPTAAAVDLDGWGADRLGQ